MMSKRGRVNPTSSIPARKAPETDDAYASYWLHESELTSDMDGKKPVPASGESAADVAAGDAYSEYWQDCMS